VVFSVEWVNAFFREDMRVEVDWAHSHPDAQSAQSQRVSRGFLRN
jgi:hypothetical protein